MGRHRTVMAAVTAVTAGVLRRFVKDVVIAVVVVPRRSVMG